MTKKLRLGVADPGYRASDIFRETIASPSRRKIAYAVVAPPYPACTLGKQLAIRIETYLGKNASLLKGDVSIGETLGSLITTNPTPADS